MSYFSCIEFIFITSLMWSLSSSMVYLVNLKACVPTEWIFLISASCQSFSKSPILKLVVKHEKKALCVCVCV